MTQSYRFDLSPYGDATGVLQLGDVGPDYMAINDRPSEPSGPNLPEWKQFVGSYSSTAYGQATTEKVTLKNGYLYWAGLVKLYPYRSGIFFTADGEAVEFGTDGKMTYGNRQFAKGS